MSIQKQNSIVVMQTGSINGRGSNHVGQNIVEHQSNYQGQCMESNREGCIGNNQQAISSNNLLISARPRPNITNQKIVITCNCKKSKCLKFYCECYTAGGRCSQQCKCLGCENNNDKEFKGTSKSGEDDSDFKKQKERTCNCKKTNCQKKYCQCFNANMSCSESCGCEDCKNIASNESKVSLNEEVQPLDNIAIQKQIQNCKTTKYQTCQSNDKDGKVPLSINQKQINSKINQLMGTINIEYKQDVLDFLNFLLS